MNPERVSDGLHQLVEHLRSDPARSVSPAEAAAITEVLLTSMHRYFSSINGSIYKEFRLLSERIKQAREEIAALRPTEMSQHRLPRAGKELEAIVQFTEEASGIIMDAAETIMAGDPGDSGYGDMVQENCLRIFEACSFQDLTGQRISKVVDTLTFIEDRLTHMSAEWGPELQETGGDSRSGDRALLNGPSLHGEGIDQSQVDALMTGSAAQPAPAPAPKPAPAAAAKRAPVPKPAPAGARSAPKPAPAAAKPAPAPEQSGETFSQDEIDALFA